MTLFSRRRAIMLGIAGVALAGTAFVARPVLRSQVRGALVAAFGRDVADHPECVRFTADFLARAQTVGGPQGALLDVGSVLRNWLRPAEPEAIPALAVEYFLRSSNVVRAHEAAVPLQYVAFFDPYEAPCANQLAAAAF